MHTTPAHKQTDPAKKPGQVLSFPLGKHFNEDMMDDMAQYAEPCRFCGVNTPAPCDTPPPVMCDQLNERLLAEQSAKHKASVTAAAKTYRPAHGGYPG